MPAIYKVMLYKRICATLLPSGSKAHCRDSLYPRKKFQSCDITGVTPMVVGSFSTPRMTWSPTQCQASLRAPPVFRQTMSSFRHFLVIGTWMGTRMIRFAHIAPRLWPYYQRLVLTGGYLLPCCCPPKGSVSRPYLSFLDKGFQIKLHMLSKRVTVHAFWENMCLNTTLTHPIHVIL